MALTVQEILNSNIPSPTWALRPTNAAPTRSDVTFERPDKTGGDSKDALTLDSRYSRFRERGADVPRINGPQQRLLIESGPTTNYVSNSTRPAQEYFGWNESGVSTSEKPSVIDDARAKAFAVTANSGQGSHILGSAGSFNKSTETISAIFEEFSSSKVLLVVENKSTVSNVAGASFDMSSNTVSGLGGTEYRAHVRELPMAAPSGKRVLEMTVSYAVSDNIKGDSRGPEFFPDRTGNDKSTIFHNVQISNKAQRSSPISTGGSALTRGNDDLSFPAGDWHNSKEGTWIIDIQPRQYTGNLSGFLLETGNFGFLGFDGGNNDFAYVPNGEGTPLGLALNNTPLSLGQVAPLFENTTVAVSMKDGFTRLAANGSVGSRADDHPLRYGTNFVLGHNVDSAAIQNVKFIPKLLSKDQLKTLTQN